MTVSLRAVLLALAAAGLLMSQQSPAGSQGSQNPAEPEEARSTQSGRAAELSPHRRGDIFMARRMYREAIEAYREGIREVAVMYNKIGIAYHHLMNFDAALENYRKALMIQPDYAEAINNIGTVYYAKKDYRRAIREYERALRITPRSASIYSNLGTAHFARKKYDAAFEAWQKALEIDPEVFEHRSTQGTLLQERSVEERAQFHFYLAKTYAKAGALERALQYLRRALEEGFKDRDKIRKDPDLKVLAGNEEFEKLLAMEVKVL